MAISNHGRSTDSGKIPALDGVRGFAILLVLLVHLQQTGVVPAQYHLVNLLMHAGWSGVDLFFVLSGFLITLGLLDSKGSINYFSAFYMRRVLRIFPLYYLAIGVAIVCSLIFANYVPKTALLLGQPDGALFPTWAGWISHVLYVQNWWMPLMEPASRNVLGHFWSLGIEEQFYLAWPLCVWLLPRNRLMILAVSLSVLALALRFVLAAHHVPLDVIHFNTLTRADTLLVGGLCAIIVRDQKLLARTRPWLPVVAVLGIFYVAGIGFLVKDVGAQIYGSVTLGFSAFALTFGSLVTWAYLLSGRRNWSDRLLSLPALTRLGKYSYGIYVYHLPIVYLAKIRFGTSPWFGHDLVRGFLFVFSTIALAFGVAALSYELFEKRFLRLKRYFKPAFKRAPDRDLGGSPSRAATAIEAR